MNTKAVVLRIENTHTFLDRKIPSEDYQDFKRYLGYKSENAIFMIKANSRKKEQWREEWDGYISTVCYNQRTCRCENKKSGIHFPSGLISTAIYFFKQRGYNVSIQDCRIKHSQGNFSLSMSDEFEMRDYQQEAADTAHKATRGLIRCATGGGKTSIASNLIKKLSVAPAIFYVPSIDLLTQSKQELERFLRKDGEPFEVGQIGGGIKDIKDINVMTIQTAVRALGGTWVKYDDESKNTKETVDNVSKDEIKKLIQNAKLIIGDEVQHWASETCQIISDHSVTAQYRFGMSATIYRDKGDDILIEGCFGRKMVDISASDLIKRKYLVKPTIYFLPVKNMKNVKKTSYPNIYKYAIVENEMRNNWISNMTKSFYEQDRKILILVKQIQHGKILEKLIPESVFIHGSHSSKKREEQLNKMRQGERGITISSVIFDEGVDCKPLDTLILAGSGKSSTRALQRIGRVIRPYPGKEEAIVVDFEDHCKYLLQQSKQRKKIYQTEPEFDIKRLEGIE